MTLRENETHCKRVSNSPMCMVDDATTDLSLLKKINSLGKHVSSEKKKSPII